MAGRGGGVHISIVVVVGVICLGLIFVVVQLSSEVQAKDDAIKNVNDKLAKSDKELKSRVASLRKAHEIMTGDADAIPDYADWENRIAEGKKLAAEATGNPEINYGSVQDLYSDLFVAIRKYRDEAGRQREMRANKDDELNQQIETNTKSKEEKDATIATLRDEINTLQTSVEGLENDSKEEADRLRGELERQDEENSAQVADLERRVWIERSLRLKAEDRISHLERELKKEETFQDVDPDGQVVQVANDLGYAWINIGQNDRLTRGIVFDVFQYVKGGRKLRKGSIEVLEVDDTTAKVGILQTFDRLNPIAKDDSIASPFYNRDETPIFVIAGEELNSNRISKDELVRRIGKYGGKVEDKVSIETTYLVALNGYEESLEYESARKLGVTILREGELLRFLD